MKLAIMQPYFFPYLGYFQLIHAVDKFISFDDVNFINKGWVNRNRILVKGDASLITVPLAAASQNKKINETEIAIDDKWKGKMLRNIEFNYKKAPYFQEVFPQIARLINSEERNIARFNYHQLRMLCEYLQINTEIVASSSVYGNRELKGQERIIDICVKEGADTYVNPAGGVDLYDAGHFKKNGIKLFFLKSSAVNYPQFDGNFVAGLSIIDVMMFNGKDRIKEYLRDCKLVEGTI